MRRQPKYSFLRNSSYALKGLMDIFENETSFKIECFFLPIVIIIIICIDISLTNKIILFISYFMILTAEVINSAIERVVDLVTLEHHEMAGRAKDAGSTIVFLSIIQFFTAWIIILFDIYF